MLKQSRLFFIVVILSFIAGCTPVSYEQAITTGSFQAVTGRDLRIVTGQMLQQRTVFMNIELSGMG